MSYTPKPRPRRPQPTEEVPWEDAEREAEATQLRNLQSRKKKGVSEKIRKLTKALKKVRTVPQLLRLFKIRTSDYVLIGDGSATRWKYEAGWACTTINTITGDRDVICGGANTGTNILAEMMAYIYAIIKITKLSESSTLYLNVFTDCEYVVQAANNPHQRRAYREVWHMMDAYKRRGVIIKWHWIPRDTLNLNQLAHNTANLARVAMKKLVDEGLSSMDVESVYELTPNKSTGVNG